MMTKTETARAFVRGEPGKCHNATTDGQTYFLHGHPIVVKSGRRVVFYWCGFYTRTTAAHMNEVLKVLGVQFAHMSYAAARDAKATHWVLEAA